MFDNPILEIVDDRVAAAWIKTRGLREFDDSVPQQLALEDVAYASPIDFLSYQFEPAATDHSISPFRAKLCCLADSHKTPRDLRTLGDGGPNEEG